MADIVCPKCGKPNPAGSTTCRYCNSRLTAAVNNPTVPIPPAENSDGTLDWLNSLRRDTNPAASPWNEQSAEENPLASDPGGADVPDWLQRIREHNQDSEEENPPVGESSSGQSSSEKEQLPDWLNQTNTNASSSSTNALEDWLKKLHEDEPVNENKKVAPSQPSIKPALSQSKTPAAQPDDETSEWLKGLQTWKPNLPVFDDNPSNDQAVQSSAESSISDQKTSSNQPAAQENIESTDWVKGSSTPEPDTPAQSQPQDQATPDLLSRIPEQPPVSPDEMTSIGGHTGVTDWLKHLPAQLKENPPAGTGSSQKSGITDWLRDLRPQSDLAASTEPKPTYNVTPGQPIQEPAALPSEETPDWLKNLASRAVGAASPTHPVQGPPTVPAEEIPDWLKDNVPNQAAAPVQSAPEPAALPAEKTADWLKNFAPSSTEAAAQPVELTPAAPSEETPDWLKEFAPGPAEATNPAQPVEQIPAVPSEETPDWLKAFAPGPAEAGAPAQPAPEPAALPAEETPDWLKDFAPGPAEAAAPTQTVEQAPAEETPDWLKSFAPGPAEAAAPAEETPDWLKNFSPGPVEAAAQAQPVEQAPAAAAEETPDWLKNFSPGPAEAVAPAEETPDWFKSFAPSAAETAAFPAALPAQQDQVTDQPQAIAAQPAEEIQAQPAAPFDSAVKDSQTPGVSQTAGPAEQAQVQPPLSGDMPDWLQNMAGSQASIEASAALASEQPAGETAPGWLQSFGSAGSTTSSQDSAGTVAQPSGEASDSENAGQAEPDWLSKITNVIPPVDQPGATPITPAIDTGGAVLGEIPDWLSNIKPQEIPAQEETGKPAFVQDSSSMELPASDVPGKNPFAGEDIPNWLSEVPEGAETQSAQTGQADGSTEQLEPAQLPGWLQAMRPLEAVAPAAIQVDDQRVEKSGPLAGLKGVLPGDEAVTQYRKPPSYSVKLKVTEKQRASANLLEQMLGQESSSQAIPQDHVRIPQRLVRLAIAILLIAVLLFPLLTGGASLIPPTLTPPTGVAQFHSVLDALPDGGHVLLAVDYDPGFAGEMHFAATGVLERLIEKNETLVLLSTVPAGPVMAQNLITQALQDRPDLAAKYFTSASVINLGYLPGGATSLQEFAAAPRQATQYGFNAGVDANSPWQQPALQNIQDVSQFSMVMVLTDSLDSGRAWIEQVQPALKTAPLMMVVSAQTAPLIQPYVDSGQVKAMISGLAGGTAFQQYLKTAVIGSSDWNAYTYGLLILVAFILLGIILQIGNFLFAHRKGGG